ncbi:MAG: type II CAAX endopeptidase family protein [Pseudanabaenaceae cyanobacterium SKYGB_i_bin29]|nr:CPBP family intramembrane metalloprotease [Pseudanabaenaceae cyanobacterium SKYG29]MDW8422540.1 type II CAAX endopeptidase family protein [Pseudanabaenaceae cyanobacterium SKYGB_i_bin29]
MLQSLRRFCFLILSVFACYIIFLNLYRSWFTPPPQTRLDRLQTDLILQAITSDRVRSFLDKDLINNFYRLALDDYLKVTDRSQVIYQVGLLYIKTGQLEKAFTLWEEEDSLQMCLRHLWQPNPQVLSGAEDLIKQKLDGWYEYFALYRLYELAKPQLLPVFTLQETIEAESAFVRLIIVNFIPIVGSLLGLVVLIVYGLKLRQSDRLAWQIPWDGETLWYVLVSWFCTYTLVAQTLPRVLGGWFSNFNFGQAFVIGISYVGSMVPLLVIFRIFLSRFPNWQSILYKFSPLNWKTILWGGGGYLGAIPLVVSSSLVQQFALRGRGGGNPLLEIISHSQNYWSITIFWITLGISAPLFEELLFRGFLLPTFTKYLHIRVAILLSALLFAVAHMNINDILPLTVLGVVLGVVYDRSRNLISPIVLHSLWNTGSFVSILLLSS